MLHTFITLSVKYYSIYRSFQLLFSITTGNFRTIEIHISQHCANPVAATHDASPNFQSRLVASSHKNLAKFMKLLNSAKLPRAWKNPRIVILNHRLPLQRASGESLSRATLNHRRVEIVNAALSTTRNRWAAETRGDFVTAWARV